MRSDSEHEIARNSLQKALARLEGAETHSGSDSESVVVVVIGPREKSNSITDAVPNASNTIELNHPGLEKFTLSSSSAPSELKSCFMEPDRKCVNSGACEMRGY